MTALAVTAAILLGLFAAVCWLGLMLLGMANLNEQQVAYVTKVLIVALVLCVALTAGGVTLIVRGHPWWGLAAAALPLAALVALPLYTGLLGPPF